MDTVPAYVQTGGPVRFFAKVRQNSQPKTFPNLPETVFITFKEPRNRLQEVDSASLRSLSPYFYAFMEPRNRFRQPMYPGGPVRQIGLSYQPTRLGIDFWLLKRFTNTGSVLHGLIK
jgi:hypothetical protein